MVKQKARIFVLFAIGLFSQTHVIIVGSIAISELFMFLAAPFLFMSDYAKLKRHGLLPLLYFAVMAMVGCVLASYHNCTQVAFAMRGFAMTYSLFALPVVFHHFLWSDMQDLEGMKWLLVGTAISGVLTIFSFQSGVEQAVGARLAGGTVESDLFIPRHFGGVLSLPLEAWYLKVPTLLGVLCYVILPISLVVFTSTGRSSVMLLGITLFMLFYVRRAPVRMFFLKRRLLSFVIIAGVSIALTMQGYKYAALHGYLNEGAQKKYEKQAQRGRSGALGLIMRGRSEFFVGLMACMENPLWGYGPWPIDRDGVYERFLYEYGDPEDVRQYEQENAFFAKMGYSMMRLIPTHSFIIGNWAFYGLLGLPFWLYVLWKLFELVKYFSAIPGLFGYFSIELPALCWAIFFSPFANRFSVCLSLTLVMLAIAAGKGRLMMPPPYYCVARGSRLS